MGSSEKTLEVVAFFGEGDLESGRGRFLRWGDPALCSMTSEEFQNL